jgi:6-phospho-3-hexuloisomerase
MRNDSSHELLKRAIKEVEGVFTPSTFSQLDNLFSVITSADSIVCYGVGREGLMMKSLTMRLMHLGLNAYFVGDMNVPPVGKKDLLLVSAGPGYFSTVSALVDVALDESAKVCVFTAQPELLAPKNYQLVVHIPAQTLADDQKAEGKVLPMGSLYEAALFLFFEIVILSLRENLNENADSMRARHTNLE